MGKIYSYKYQCRRVGCPADLRPRAGASCQGASTATSTSRSERVYRLRSRLSCCWRQPCCVIAASWRPTSKALNHGHGIPLDLRPVSPSDRSLVCPATQCMVIHLHCRLLQHPGYLQMSVGGVLIGKATFLRWRHETAWGGATKSLWRTRDRNYLPRHVKEWW